MIDNKTEIEVIEQITDDSLNSVYTDIKKLERRFEKLESDMFNERVEYRRQIEALTKELERWRHGQEVEGDYVCPFKFELERLKDGP